MPDDCTHSDPKKLILINRVTYCLLCQTYLSTGLCTKCNAPLDNHNLRDELAPICPKAGELVAP